MVDKQGQIWWTTRGKYGGHTGANMVDNQRQIWWTSRGLTCDPSAGLALGDPASDQITTKANI